MKVKITHKVLELKTPRKRRTTLGTVLSVVVKTKKEQTTKFIG
tara:strand:+ start:292 stop:420 length:129 start_codon:yes stop_codon:yes gene_type:complete